MAVHNAPSSTPPPGSFSVWQRVLRGYGPMAVPVVLLLLMAVLVPSKSQDTVSTNSSGIPGVVGTDDVATGMQSTVTCHTVPTGQEPTAAAGGSGNAAAADPTPRATTRAVAQPCSDRKLQVPGGPYSPPCAVFSG